MRNCRRQEKTGRKRAARKKKMKKVTQEENVFLKNARIVTLLKKSGKGTDQPDRKSIGSSEKK